MSEPHIYCQCEHHENGAIPDYYRTVAAAGRHLTDCYDLGYVPTHLVIETGEGENYCNWARYWAKSEEDAQEWIKSDNAHFLAHPSRKHEFKVIAISKQNSFEKKTVTIPTFYFGGKHYLAFSIGQNHYHPFLTEYDAFNYWMRNIRRLGTDYSKEVHKKELERLLFVIENSHSVQAISINGNGKRGQYVIVGRPTKYSPIPAFLRLRDDAEWMAENSLFTQFVKELESVGLTIG